MELWSELWKVAGRPFCYETLGESCCHSWTSSRFRFLGNCSHLKRSFSAGQWHVTIHPDDKNSVICPEILVIKVMPQIISIFHKGFHFQLPFLWCCILNRDTATLLDATTLESFLFQPTRSTTRMPSNLVVCWFYASNSGEAGGITVDLRWYTLPGPCSSNTYLDPFG